jgi:hypothetical protein
VSSAIVALMQGTPYGLVMSVTTWFNPLLSNSEFTKLPLFEPVYATTGHLNMLEQNVQKLLEDVAQQKFGPVLAQEWPKMQQ